MSRAVNTDDKVPFYGLDREFQIHRQQYTEIMHRVFSHGKVLQGSEVSRFESKVGAFCDRRFAIAVNSCTDALFFSLTADGIKPGDEVLVTDFSFVASASCILRLGAKPVFVDIDESYNMDLNKAGSLVTDKTKALIYVHLYGQMGRPQEIEDFAESHNLILIEDAAQAFGATYGDRKAGSLGLLSCLSFDPTKIIGAPGSGGMVLTDSKDLALHIMKLRYHGKNQEGEFVSLGYNSQMPSFTAAILDFKVDQNDNWLDRRRWIAKYYLDNISNDFILPFEKEGSCHNYHKFVIRAKKRDQLRSFLSQNNIQTVIHYAVPLHKQSCFQLFGYKNRDFQATISISKEVLSLPIHSFLKDDEVQLVVEAVNAFK